MPELAILVHGQRHGLSFQPGPSLRELLDRSAYRVRSACLGHGACGLCRVRLTSEMAVQSPYRQCRVDYTDYEDDLTPDEGDLEGFDRARLVQALTLYLRRRELEIDWDTAEQAPPEPLINSLSIALPFEPASKQLLLEAPTLEARAEALMAVLEIDTAMDPDDGGPSFMQ